MGTHIDAPYHFFENGSKVDEIPIKNLVSVNARIIDVSKQCQETKNYLITVDDVKKKDFIVPEIDENTGEKFLFVLIFYTGWTKYWPDQLTYAGGESELEFPGLSDQLATYLVDTYGDQLVGIGIDTLSSKYPIQANYFISNFYLFS
jgi:kynurenine formamidase